MLCEFLVFKMSRKFLISISLKDGLNMIIIKNMYGGNVAKFSQQCNTEAEVVFCNRDMEVKKELTKLCVSKNQELKENETNARVVIPSRNVKRSIIE
ncbi:hypothetical protein Gohar_013299 [Gossypium harknessii]|uniref:Uncharacterized protein n=1 Tax=Gossypium harknessii TaxID=34285 RepID=A0A7J9GZP4_9ROSI|nr:hypothetical protein [Gossypium harknessii]